MPYEDPLAAYAVQWPEQLVDFFQWAGYTKLAPHLHEVLGFAILYSSLYKLSKFYSPVVIPQYSSLSHRNKVNFDMHAVSQVQAIFLCAVSFPMFFDKNLDSLTSYTPYSGFVIASATGYFIWDAVVCWKYRQMFGLGFLAHAISALFTFTQTSRPFLYNFAAPFMWFEASTIFVNNHWFGTHVPGLLSDQFILINGLVLIAVFFLCRIVSGPYNGFFLFSEVFTSPPAGVPTWAVVSVLASYATLTGLNLFWFSKMISSAVRRFSAKPKAE